MQKPQLSRLARYLLIAAGITLGVAAGALALSPAARESVACDVSTEVQFSPGGTYRAQAAETTCRWGMGQPHHIEVKVDKPDDPGWFLVLPLEPQDHAHPSPPAPAPAGTSPALRWKGANALEVVVYSSELSGAVVRRVDGLTVTRRYVKPPREKKAA